MAKAEGRETAWVANLIRNEMIDNWEIKDEPQHFRTIRDRILKSQFAVDLLQLLQQIFTTDWILRQSA